MGKFILLLIFIFVFFYFGASVLFDSGITKSSGVSRVPAVVEMEKNYYKIKKVGDSWGMKAYLLGAPLLAATQKFFSGR